MSGEARCVGCGRRLAEGAERCAACSTPAVGAWFSESIFLGKDARYSVPQLCCCCLDRTLIVDEEQTSDKRGNYRYTVRFGIPWCATCRDLRARARRVSFAIGLALGALAWPIAGLFTSDGSARFLVTCIWTFCALVIAFVVVVRVVPGYRLRGHVPGCDAVHASATKSGARITFANRAFGRLVRALRDRLADDPIAMELLADQIAARRELLAAAAAEPVRPRDQTLERRLSAEALHDEARSLASAESRGYGRHRSGLADVRAGADAASEKLRFVAKECAFGDASIVIHTRDRREREVAWSAICRASVRMLPAGPPFDRALIVDLASREGPPVRITASTRANYAALPGSGVTSQENFRRLLAHLVAKNPSVELDSSTDAFQRSGRTPERLETFDEVAAWDAHYGA